MPVFSTPEEYNNGYVPSGNALPKPEGFDVSPPKGTNPPPKTVVSNTSHLDMLFSSTSDFFFSCGNNFHKNTKVNAYIVGASKCLRDIQTHAQYINSMAGKF